MGVDFVGEELCSCCKLHRGDCVHVVIIHQGSMCTLQKHGGGVMFTHTQISSRLLGWRETYCSTIDNLADELEK